MASSAALARRWIRPMPKSSWPPMAGRISTVCRPVVSGGSDLIYLPHGDRQLARRIAALLTGLDYVGALFVDEQFGAIPGALPLSSIALQGSARLPPPAMVLSFKTFALAARNGAD